MLALEKYSVPLNVKAACWWCYGSHLEKVVSKLAAAFSLSLALTGSIATPFKPASNL
jgi:hypothetical protein